MKYILGTKIGMTQKFQETGSVVGVTAVKAGPCTVVQVKTVENDGYAGVQIGLGSRKKLNKAAKGHLRKTAPFRYLREFRDEVLPQEGDVITVGAFEVGEKVKVVGTSKGKGFQGVVKRHGFAGMPKTHGTKDQVRMPGSIGATGPAHVFKGKKMPGRMGADQVTTSGLEIIEIDDKEGIIYIKGAVPGPINGLVEVKGLGELKVNIEPVKEEVTEVVAEESVSSPVEVGDDMNEPSADKKSEDSGKIDEKTGEEPKEEVLKKDEKETTE